MTTTLQLAEQLASEMYGLHCDIGRLEAENQKLREACADLLHMAESYDPEWFHWPEMHEHLRKLGVEVGNEGPVHEKVRQQLTRIPEDCRILPARPGTASRNEQVNHMSL